jgi:hypothetical protein
MQVNARTKHESKLKRKAESGKRKAESVLPLSITGFDAGRNSKNLCAL